MTTAWPREILERYHAEPFRLRPGTWRARCPAHDDSTPSLSIWLGRDGRLMIGCWAGCAKDRILAAKGLTMRDLFPPRADGKTADEPLKTREIAEVYDYRDEAGALLYQSLRYEPKDFRQRRPDGRWWKWSLDGVRLVVYRLPELLAAPPSAPVLVPEGERKVDRLRSLGFVATCNVGGCGMGWLPSYSLALAGRRVVVLPDCDAAGVKHAFGVVGSLMAHGAASVRFVALPGLSERQDVIDWLDAGRTKRDLIEIVQSYPEWRPA